MMSRMCCFSRPVISVSATNIFAREAPEGGQYLAYSMTLSAAEDLAMILPLPVPPGALEDAITFIDLSGYPAFFSDLAKGFPEPVAVGRGPIPRSNPAPLAVVEVGSFEASFVPTVDDFERLDPRFRLPVVMWSRLGGYGSFGFAVFKLKAGNKRIHPMAFVFPRADASKLFFPTVHIHDGDIHAEADFDHALFCQRAERPANGLPTSVAPDRTWSRSAEPARVFARPARSQGLIEGDAHCLRRRIKGRAPNRDIYVDA